MSIYTPAIGKNKRSTGDKMIDRFLDKLDEEKYPNLLKQIEDEYKVALDFQKPKLETWYKRLKLYNNQTRKKDAVGDPLLFTIFQTVLVSIYFDKLMVEFVEREEGDEEIAETLTNLAKYDYDLMEKDVIDFFWIWDALFFGRSYVLFYNFDSKEKVPVPEIIDPTTLLRDPRAVAVNGYRGRNFARFLGRELWFSRYEFENDARFKDKKDVVFSTPAPSDSLVAKAREMRQTAQEHNIKVKDKFFEGTDNEEIAIIEWFTHYKGKKIVAYTTSDFKSLLHVVELKDTKEWPIIDRTIYPTSHDWDGTSIPDLVEDKQRQRAVVQNLSIKMLKYILYPMYLYDQSRIPNKANLRFDFNKFIPVQGSPAGAVEPLNKVNPNLALVDYILQTLDTAAQRATATPEIQQGIISSERRTLGELNLVASKVDTRYSLAAKIFGWSEKRFWRQWYWIYKKKFKKNMGEKIVRIQGAFGAKWRKLTPENLKTKKDPDIRIESFIVSEAKRIKERNSLLAFAQVLLQDPGSNKRYVIKKLARLYGFEKDEIERMIPPTIDEMRAEEENEALNKNKTVPISANDDHVVHLEIHKKANQTPATFAHIEAHKAALLLAKERPELFPQLSNQQSQKLEVEKLKAQAQNLGSIADILEVAGKPQPPSKVAEEVSKQ